MKKEYTFLSADKTSQIHVVEWIPEGEIKAILQISHGMIEFIDRYEDFALFLNFHNFLVVGNDHIGHGKTVATPEDFGYFGKKDGGGIIVRDLHTLTKKIKEEHPGVPYFLLGHSMGSFMARRYIINYSEDIDGSIIMGTGNQPDVILSFGRLLTGLLTAIRGPRFRSKLVAGIAFMGYDKRIPKTPDAGNWMTSDVKILEGLADKPEAHFIFTVSAYKQMFDTITYIKKPENIARIRNSLPVLVIAGTDDPVGEYGKGVKQCYDALKESGIKDITLEMVENARHEVLNELNRAETYEYILNWLESRI